MSGYVPPLSKPIPAPDKSRAEKLVPNGRRHSQLIGLLSLPLSHTIRWR